MPCQSQISEVPDVTMASLVTRLSHDAGDGHNLSRRNCSLSAEQIILCVPWPTGTGEGPGSWLGKSLFIYDRPLLSSI